MVNWNDKNFNVKKRTQQKSKKADAPKLQEGIFPPDGEGERRRCVSAANVLGVLNEQVCCYRIGTIPVIIVRYDGYHAHPSITTHILKTEIVRIIKEPSPVSISSSCSSAGAGSASQAAGPRLGPRPGGPTEGRRQDALRPLQVPERPPWALPRSLRPALA